MICKPTIRVTVYGWVPNHYIEEVSWCLILEQGKDRTPEERRVAICIFDDVAEQCRDAAIKWGTFKTYVQIAITCFKFLGVDLIIDFPLVVFCDPQHLVAYWCLFSINDGLILVGVDIMIPFCPSYWKHVMTQVPMFGRLAQRQNAPLRIGPTWISLFHGVQVDSLSCQFLHSTFVLA